MKMSEYFGANVEFADMEALAAETDAAIDAAREME